MRSLDRHGAASLALMGLLFLLVLPFAIYAASFGFRAVRADISATTYLIARGAPVSNGAMAGHMLAGAAITALVPLQIARPVRERWPALHRWTGRLIATLAIAAGIGGLAFVLVRGTIGGMPMDAGFGLYGLLLLGTALATPVFAARGEIARHRRWALRLTVLILASWSFRVQYGLWFLATGGIGSTDTLTGPFDRVMVLAFYLPHLALLEVWLRRTPRRAPA